MGTPSTQQASDHVLATLDDFIFMMLEASDGDLATLADHCFRQTLDTDHSKEAIDFYGRMAGLVRQWPVSYIRIAAREKRASISAVTGS